MDKKPSRLQNNSIVAGAVSNSSAATLMPKISQNIILRMKNTFILLNRIIMTLFCFINLYWLFQIEFMTDNYMYGGTKNAKMLDLGRVVLFYPFYFFFVCNLSERKLVKYLTLFLSLCWLFLLGSRFLF